MFADFLDETLKQTPGVIEPDQDLLLNLDKIKDTPFEQLNKEDRVSLALVLIKQL